ncbi:hypothetical protein AK812_SmicGene13098 [Symbiodinium microadriaticum]|uniref:Uncharacterized protein n=1 Tax=Symbiodinium microadriaticum TaxID=2951 RepID=A0A1Q9E911_SYMMI|nr:hypothetical protein AK812_SmicGene13098 [Symbiodinium microadriaticum]
MPGSTGERVDRLERELEKAHDSLDGINTFTKDVAKLDVQTAQSQGRLMEQWAKWEESSKAPMGQRPAAHGVEAAAGGTTLPFLCDFFWCSLSSSFVLPLLLLSRRGAVGDDAHEENRSALMSDIGQAENINRCDVNVVSTVPPTAYGIKEGARTSKSLDSCAAQRRVLTEVALCHNGYQLKRLTPSGVNSNERLRKATRAEAENERLVAKGTADRLGAQVSDFLTMMKLSFLSNVLQEGYRHQISFLVSNLEQNIDLLESTVVTGSLDESVIKPKVDQVPIHHVPVPIRSRDPQSKLWRTETRFTDGGQKVICVSMNYLLDEAQMRYPLFVIRYALSTGFETMEAYLKPDVWPAPPGTSGKDKTNVRLGMAYVEFTSWAKARVVTAWVSHKLCSLHPLYKGGDRFDEMVTCLYWLAEYFNLLEKLPRFLRVCRMCHRRSMEYSFLRKEWAISHEQQTGDLS